MRFASLNNSNARDYAQAGKAVADSASDSFTIMRRSGPDYGKLSEVAMNTRTAEKMAAMKAGADMATAGIKAVSGVTQTGIKTAAGMKLAKDKANRVKMAGKVAGIGAVLGGAVMAATNNKEDSSWKDKHYAAQKALQEKRIAMLDQEDANDYGRTAPPSMDGAPGVPELPSVSSGESGGAGQSLPKGNTDNLEGTFSGGSLDTESVNAIRASAKRMGVDPYSLGGLIELESGHKPNIWGGDGGNYRGLIQFGPGARSEVGLPGHKMSIAEQMPYVEKYFQQRGFTPGKHGVTEMYRTVLVGNPGQSGTDSFGTNSDSAAKRMMPGGDLYNRARSLYGGL